MAARTEPPGPRARLEDRPEGLRVEIPAPREYGTLLFLAAWLVGWFMGEKVALTHLLDAAGRPDPFLLFWLVPWTLGGMLAVVTMIWILFGWEVITLDGHVLWLRREVRGVGWVRRYELAAIENLRCPPRPERAPVHGAPWARGLIAFDHAGETIRFGAALDEAEAQAIKERLERRLGARWR